MPTIALNCNTGLAPELETRLTRFLQAIVNQEAARVLVPPQENLPGFWFGGGNLVRDHSNTFWLVGRYRNAGDSRTGTGAGARGLELALFKSTDGGATYRKTAQWTKQDLSYPDRPVVSIEGASLLLRKGRAELFVSTEKDESYPDDVGAFQKPGTGVWSIDVFEGESPESLDVATLRPVLRDIPEPEFLHVKDPVAFDNADGDTTLIFCDHPFTWSSMNSGYAVRASRESTFTLKSWELARRGPAWDVAGTRITSRMSLPALGVFAGFPPMSVYFYDGMECYREHEQSSSGVNRPRGYSCEELAGALYGIDGDFPRMTRLSRLLPLFVSHKGTGCSRYIETLQTETGIHAIWQQSQADGSQALVTHFLSNAAVEDLLK